MVLEQYFIWDGEKNVSTDSIGYADWSRRHFPLFMEYDFSMRINDTGHFLEVTYNGYVEEGAPVRPFTLLYFKNFDDDPGYCEEDFIEYFETEPQVLKRRAELIGELMLEKIANEAFHEHNGNRSN